MQSLQLTTALRASRYPRRATCLQPKRWLSSTSLLWCACSEPKQPRPAAHDELPPTDYRSIGEKHGLFSNSVYSRGSTLFHPDGAHIFRKLEAFLRAQYTTFGFQEVITPLLYKQELWEKSGHAQNYKNDMFEVTGAGDGPDADKITHTFGLKPMNCPGHCLLFSRHQKSHRDLPVRYAEFSPLHRNENDGALSGLTRARCFHQDDGHIFCRPDQVGAEIRNTLDFVKLVYERFDLGKLNFVLSTRPERKFIGHVTEWDHAEMQLKQALEKSNTGWTHNPGDGAFYGPKIDITLTDQTGKAHQTATIQLDFQLPQRFDLSYDAPSGRPERPVMVHRAIMGSIERFMALLIERYQHQWPFWLSPRQVIVLTVNKMQTDYAAEVVSALSGACPGTPGTPRILASRSFRVDSDFTDTTIGTKVRLAKRKGYNMIVTIGPKELEDLTLSVNFEGHRNSIAIEPILRGLKVIEAHNALIPNRTNLRPKSLLEVMKQMEDLYV